MKIFNYKPKAQSTIEFTFAMIVIMLIIFGMMQIFRWSGMDLAQRRYLQDSTLTTLDSSGDPASELNTDIDSSVPMAATYHGSITGNATL